MAFLVLFMAACNATKEPTVASKNGQAGFIPQEAQDVHIGMTLAAFRASQADFQKIAETKLENKAWIRFTAAGEKDISSITYYFTPNDSVLYQMMIDFEKEEDLMEYAKKEYGTPHFGGDRWLLKKEDTGLRWDINLWAHQDKLTIRRIAGGQVSPQK